VSMVLAKQLEDPYFDPDCQKVTESVDHREAVDLIALSASLALDPAQRCVRDLNWYPTPDMGVYLSPDIMVVSRATLGVHAKSYRQVELGGDPPTVALEVPSESNKVSEFAAKIRRINAYGVVAYVVDVTVGAEAVLRYEAPSIAPSDWVGRPVTELGGIVLDFVDGSLRVTGPDGTSASNFTEIAAIHAARATEEERRADEETRRADQEAQRAAGEAGRADQEARRAAEEAGRADQEAQRANELAAKLLALGYDPDA